MFRRHAELSDFDIFSYEPPTEGWTLNSYLNENSIITSCVTESPFGIRILLSERACFLVIGVIFAYKAVILKLMLSKTTWQL